jgi:hypothetical protein
MGCAKAFKVSLSRTHDSLSGVQSTSWRDMLNAQGS